MTWRTHPVTIAARSQLRRLGLTRWLAGVANGSAYEDAFNKALIQAVAPDDCVWDVGANVGYYSTKFAALAGPAGRVFAFEPSPDNLLKLHAATRPFANVQIVPKALGAVGGTGYLAQGADQLGATSRIVRDDNEQVTKILIATGDDLTRLGEVQPPNVVKIDTEGFELDVLQGMPSTLAATDLRTICVEVHFQLLSERGLPSAPAEIEVLLQNAGFRVRWTDPSHIVGSRS